METKSFRVAGLSSCWHNEKTKDIFRQCANGSITDFVTSAIVKYAKHLGFTYTEMQATLSYQPNYITDGRMIEIQNAVDKSRKKDYTYLVAFEYLRWKRPGVNTSNLYRDAIVFNSC